MRIKSDRLSAWKQVTDDELRRLRTVEKLLESDIAKLFCVSDASVQKRLKKANIVMDPEDRKAVIRERRLKRDQEQRERRGETIRVVNAASKSTQTTGVDVEPLEIRAHYPTKPRPIIKGTDILELTRQAIENKDYEITRCDPSGYGPSWPQMVCRRPG